MAVDQLNGPITPGRAMSPSMGPMSAAPPGRQTPVRQRPISPSEFPNLVDQRPTSPYRAMTPRRQMDVPANGGPAGVGITFEPKHQPGTKTHGMHVITKIRPNSPAHKSCRIQVGDILALIQQAGDPKSYSTAGMPIAKVLAMLTGPAGTGVKLHILDGQFPYLPPKIVVCTREIVPTGITQTQNKVASPVPVTTQLVPGTSSVPIYGSSAPMRSAAPMMRSAVPMDPAYGSARPFGSAAPGYVGRYPE